jgi:hypothetical protein
MASPIRFFLGGSDFRLGSETDTLQPLRGPLCPRKRTAKQMLLRPERRALITKADALRLVAEFRGWSAVREDHRMKLYLSVM